MNDDRETVIKFDPNAKRKKKKPSGESHGNGSDKKLLLKIASAVVVIATVALGYYALNFIH
jgi:hypothetical protein